MMSMIVMVVLIEWFCENSHKEQSFRDTKANFVIRCMKCWRGVMLLSWHVLENIDMALETECFMLKNCIFFMCDVDLKANVYIVLQG